MKPNSIEPRRLRFNVPKDLPRHWNDQCPVKTHIFNAISILAPAFERLAITSVLPFKNKVIDPVLQKQLAGFIGQESAHGSEFIRFNQILKSFGYEVKNLEKGNLRRFKWLANKLSPYMHLSLTLAAEHLTAIISDLILREKSWLEKSHPGARALWRWHAIEEIEHKAVVYDLFESLKGGYLTRIAGMMVVTGMIGSLLARNFFHLAKKDKLLFKLSFWIKCFTVCWGKEGFLRKLIFPYLHYFSWKFHPWQHDNHELILKWLAFFNTQPLQEVTELLHQDSIA